VTAAASTRIKESLGYDGPILHQVRHWAQELLGYFFHIMPRAQPAQMTANVDAFTRCYGPLITSYLIRSYTMDAVSFNQRPAAYEPSMFAATNPRTCPNVMPTPAPNTELPTETITETVTVTTETITVTETITETETEPLIRTAELLFLCTSRAVAKHHAHVLFLSSSPMLVCNISAWMMEKVLR
jgi:hypothetical protein